MASHTLCQQIFAKVKLTDKSKFHEYWLFRTIMKQIDCQKINQHWRRQTTTSACNVIMHVSVNPGGGEGNPGDSEFSNIPPRGL